MIPITTRSSTNVNADERCGVGRCIGASTTKRHGRHKPSKQTSAAGDRMLVSIEMYNATPAKAPRRFKEYRDYGMRARGKSCKLHGSFSGRFKRKVAENGRKQYRSACCQLCNSHNR